MQRSSFLITLVSLALGLSSVSAGEFPKGSPKFEKRYKAALAEGVKTGKPVLLVFSASWCHYCQDMKNDVYPSKEIQPFHDKFVWAYLDADEAANKKPKELYGVGGIPHIEFVDGTGKSFGQQVGASKSEAFAKELTAMLAKAPAAPAPTAPKAK